MRALSVFLTALFFCAFPLQAEPPLPSGLDKEKSEKKKDSPSLPQGLKPQNAPSLPPGLGDPVKKEGPDPSAPKHWADRLGISFKGFTEMRAGLRLQADSHEKAASIGEARLQFSLEKETSFATASLTADFLYDPVLNSHKIELESGNGWLDIREASLLFRPFNFTDLKIGRQVLTWGTGDLLFINDLFPKDWNSFFTGRDEEYLKAPSDAAKLSLFSQMANLDIIYTPRFDADRFIDGKRLSYFNTARGVITGQNAIVQTNKPQNWFKDDELSLRLYRNFSSAEVALYFYDGYWKSPGGQNAETSLALFPRLRSYGASLRRPLFNGIFHAEIGFYDSLDDKTGSDPFINNSEFRLLTGYERELAPELTGAFQYYQERLKNYDAYNANLPASFTARDKVRHVLTARLTKLAMNQTLTWSLFAYYSPSDKDGYLRPKVSRKITDDWLAEVGANIFFGENDHSFFGQFQKNTNAFLALRRSF